MLVLDCPNAFNTVKIIAVLEEFAIQAPALLPLVENCPAGIFFHMGMIERRNIPSNMGIHLGDTLGPTVFCIQVGDNLRKLRAHFEQKGAKATTYMDEIAPSSV